MTHVINQNNYSIEKLGHLSGLDGWYTVLRNGQPIMHFPDYQSADEYLKKHCNA